MIPIEAQLQIEQIADKGKEAIVKKEKGHWVVLETTRTLKYKGTFE